MGALRELQKVAKLWKCKVDFNEEQKLHFIQKDNHFFIESGNNILIWTKGDGFDSKVNARDFHTAAKQFREETQTTSKPTEGANELFNQLRG
ncbi:conserved hypothetical protein [Vibrio crassostreae]|nr:conserved hypothetical protein [Vibrio crassostreae]CAK2767496.1 conserved hypothetical protein [Vibrio crassostreae]CAK2769574.1 conserved hypothetical protein [Vibrio crassostreae]CAK2775141.1 conserved hypothetical protein [Vibrio crassostreae]CAK2778152.1 conserved hypothetical protein [Vibrio crassostreae]